MPTRIRSSVDYEAYGSVRRYNNGALASTFNHRTGFISRSMTDVVVPDFINKIRRGEYVNNPMSYVVETDLTLGNWSYSETKNTAPFDKVTRSGNGSLSRALRQELPATYLPTLPSLPLGWGSGLNDAAKASALANVDQSPYSFAEDIAEWRETLKFLRSPLASLNKVSQSFSSEVSKYTSRRKAITRAKAIADVYLSYRFAFSPLVRTASNLLKAYNDKPRRPKRRSARGYAEDTYSKTFDQHRGFSDNFLSWRGGLTYTAKAHAVVAYEVSNPVMDWRFKYGLRFKDVPEVLWAISPYSFLVDRMVNISESIRGFTNLVDPSVSILGASVTRRDDEHLDYSCYKQTHSGYTVVISPDTVMNHKFRYSRSLWHPTFRDVLPGVNPLGLVDSTTKVADLVALITQRLR